MRIYKKNFPVIVCLLLAIFIAVFAIRTSKGEKAPSLPEGFSVNINGSGNYVRLYYDEYHSSDTWYLFLPSNTDMEKSEVEFLGCETIVFEDINGSRFLQENGKRLAEGLNPYESYYIEF